MAEIALQDVSEDDFGRMRSGGGLLTGRPVPSIGLRVIRNQWGQTIAALTTTQFEQMMVASREPGEIVVSGAHVLPGYLHGEGDAETKFDVDRTRWHRTGDLGYLDEKGRLWLLGRCSAKIQDDRGTLYPFAVECAAMENSRVRRAALVSLRGRRVLAIESQAKSSREELQRSLTWAGLDEIVAVKRIPVDKRHNAKVDYVKLRGEIERVVRT